MRSLIRLNRTVLSPLLAFPLVWVAGALLSQYHVFNEQSTWDSLMLAVVAAVPLAFLAGGLIGEGIGAMGSVAREVAATWQGAPTRTYRRILIGLLVVGWLELLHQFALIGGVPLLSEGSGARFEQGGPTIILTNFLTVAATLSIARPRDLLSREARFELVVAAIAIGGFVLQGGRGSVLLPVIVATLARWMFWGRPKSWFLALAGLFAFVAVVFGFYLRVRQHPFNPFEAQLYGEILPGTPFFIQPLVPIHLAVTTNFHALQGVVGQFPTGQPFAGGSFDLVGLDLFFGGSRSLPELSAQLTPPWVTSTMAGPLWADGGFVALIPGVAIPGALCGWTFAMARRTHAFRWCLVSAYLLYTALFGVYTNLFTQQVDWVMIAPLLFVMGALAQDASNPPGLTGMVWRRIRGVPNEQGQMSEPEGQAPRREGGRPWKAVIAWGAGVLIVLVLAGLAIQRTLPDPFPVVVAEELPNELRDASEVMTVNDRPGDNEGIYWVNRKGRRGTLGAWDPNRPNLDSIPIVFETSEHPATTSYDIGIWPPNRSLTLFEFDQRPRWLEIRVLPTWAGDGGEQLFRAPLARPTAGATRDLAIATWGGERSDLFVVTRGRDDTRPTVQVLSGESGFKKQEQIATLPFRGLSVDEWQVEFADFAPAPVGERDVDGDRPDLLLIRSDPDKERADFQLMPGESTYRLNVARRDLDVPGEAPPGTTYMAGSYKGGNVLFRVEPDAEGGPRVQVIALTSIPGLQ